MYIYIYIYDDAADHPKHASIKQVVHARIEFAKSINIEYTVLINRAFDI